MTDTNLSKCQLATAEQYKQAQARAKQLEAKLARLMERAKDDPKNWGYHGDFQDVNRRLADLLAFVD